MPQRPHASHVVEDGRVFFARSGDVSLACKVGGHGPLDLIVVPGFVSHLEVSLELPNIASIFQRLTSFARVITFDKRGTGMSDRTVELPTLADRMDDIRAVMDAVGCERAALVGISEGGPAAAMFAATYPERVSALVLWVANLAPALDQRSKQEQDAIALFDDYIGSFWGDGTSMRILVGAGAPQEPSVDELLARFERYSATPSAAQAVIRRSFSVDSRAIRSSVSVPTLFVSHRDDPVISFEGVQETAKEIPDARVVATSASGHISWDIAEHEDLDVIEQFLTGSLQSRATFDRKLVTILFTDIVGSTELAFRLGDQRWASLLDLHDAAVRLELQRFRGRELSTTGDGFVAAFDGPARAVECAHAIARRARVLNLDIRAGLHTGECEVRGEHLTGVTLHVAARVLAQAGTGEVLVSRTVRDLVESATLGFESRGFFELKGVPEKVELFIAFPGSEPPPLS
jgi:class 3 adenylate cyclase